MVAIVLTFGVASFTNVDPRQTLGAAGTYFNDAIPTLKDQPMGGTLATDAMAGDVAGPKSTGLGVNLGSSSFAATPTQGAFSNPLSNTGLQ